MKLPQYYNMEIDKLQDVTQEWIDNAQKTIATGGLQKDLIKRISSITNREKLIKISQFMLTLEI